MPDYKRGKDTIQWLKSDRRATTIPISSAPALADKTIIGSAFFLQYESKFYLISAKHVIQDPHALLFFTKERAIATTLSATLQSGGIEWVPHPDGLDLAALSVPWSIIGDKEVKVVPEANWNVKYDLKKGDEIAHLGYPERIHANFNDGQLGLEAVAMIGEVLGKEYGSIVVETDSDEGASGGPAYFDHTLAPLVFGVATHVRRQEDPNDPGKFLKKNKTVVLPICHVKAILDSKEMATQCSISGWHKTH